MKVLAFKPRTAVDYQARINRVLAHMSQRIDADLSTEELARVANLSPFHFHRIFRAITGESPSAMRERARTAANALDRVPGCFLAAANRPDLKTSVLEKQRQGTGDTMGSTTKRRSHGTRRPGGRSVRAGPG